MTTAEFFSSAEAFRRWLEANAETASEVLVGFHKVGTGKSRMSWSESVDQALCFGWIDGVGRRIDDETYCIRFTPRRPASIWSAINIAKVAQLEANGKMMPSGRQAFAARTAARSAIYAHEQKVAAEFLAEELQVFKRSKAAWTFFEATPPGYKKGVLHWINGAKKSTTRTARFAALLEASVAGQRLAQF